MCMWMMMMRKQQTRMLNNKEQLFFFCLYKRCLFNKEHYWAEGMNYFLAAAVTQRRLRVARVATATVGTGLPL